jgi:hypothetical protein
MRSRHDEYSYAIPVNIRSLRGRLLLFRNFNLDLSDQITTVGLWQASRFPEEQYVVTTRDIWHTA